MCMNDIPDEQLRVFISSAQSNEGGFAWSEVRRRIKKYLKECPYLNPFIMEDVASPVPSGQFYQRQLLRADIVVLLVKGEVREGTATEYALATKYKKPMLIYFLDDGTIHELSAISLKKDVQERDYCTYRSMSSFDDIEKVVRKNVIECVICYFQDMALHGELLAAGTEETSLPNETQQTKHSIPTRTAIALFSSSYNHIFDLLSIPQVKREDASPDLSVLHNLGVASLDWLMTGQSDISDKDILDLIDCVSVLYSDTSWLSRRWDAIRHEMIGDIDGALKAENQALIKAKESNMPPWIVADILIDCRNIENEINYRAQKILVEGNGQKELNRLDTIVYLPVLDRYLGMVYGALAKETAKYKMAKPGTVFFGSSIESVINDVENYFFTAMLYGSYTHMLIARDLLAQVLYQYDELTGKAPLLFDCVKLLILYGNAKSFQNVLEHKWDDVYLSVAPSADELWYLTGGVPSSSRDSMKRVVLAKLGMYMTDDCFKEAEIYLKSKTDSVCGALSEHFFECIYQNINRLDANVVVEMLTNIISKQHFHLGSKLAQILLCLNISDVPQEAQVALCKALEEKAAYIVSNGGTPQFIAALVMQNKEVFEVLASIPNNGLHGTEKLFYEINTGDGDWNKVIYDQIEIAKHQLEINKSSAGYHDFADRPFMTIKKAIREHYNEEMACIIAGSLIPLCIDVLGSHTTTDMKDDCIDCLCDVFIYSNSEEIIITQELIDAIENIEVSETWSMMGISKNTLTCRVLMLRVITGIADKEEMMEWCFDFAKKDRTTKVALAECIEQYLCRYAYDPVRIDAMVFSIVLQCFEDEYWQVRRMACNCLVQMLSTCYKERAVLKLYEGAIDPSHYVRNHLLRMCKDGEIGDASISNRIIDILRNDANYAIRTFANS